MTELALMLPFLVALLSIIIEGGFAINAWIRVNSAARDATRFALDAGRPDQTATLVLSKLSGIEFGSRADFTATNKVDVYIITGTTSITGSITSWVVTHQYGPSSAGPKVQRSTIQTRLNSQGGTSGQNVPFTIVEVDYRYQPLLATLIARGSLLPMTSYAIVQQY
jgi:hypothetical protein